MIPLLVARQLSLEAERDWYEDETNLYNSSGILLASIVQLQQSAAEATTKIINPTGTVIDTTEDLQ